MGLDPVPCMIILCAASGSFWLTSPMLQYYLKKKECANVRPRTIAPFRALVQPNIAYSFLSEASSSYFDIMAYSFLSEASSSSFEVSSSYLDLTTLFKAKPVAPPLKAIALYSAILRSRKFFQFLTSNFSPDFFLDLIR
jgi:hypothetical protein